MEGTTAFFRSLFFTLNLSHSITRCSIFRNINSRKANHRTYLLYLHIEILLVPLFPGARGGVVVEALRYKPEGRGFDSRWYHWIFSLT
jgi:hypothetical protein